MGRDLCAILWNSDQVIKARRTDGRTDGRTEGNPISPFHDKVATGDKNLLEQHFTITSLTSIYLFVNYLVFMDSNGFTYTYQDAPKIHSKEYYSTTDWSWAFDISLMTCAVGKPSIRNSFLISIDQCMTYFLKLAFLQCTQMPPIHVAYISKIWKISTIPAFSAMLRQFRQTLYLLLMPVKVPENAEIAGIAEDLPELPGLSKMFIFWLILHVCLIVFVTYN